jgi:hypothetical protein
MAKGRHSRRRVHRRRSSKVIIGGDGAAAHAISTYGGIGQQHPVSATNHTIAVNTGTAVVPALVKGGADLAPALVTGGADLAPALVTGGGDLAPAQLNGGGIITDIAVPAALIYTRNVIAKRRLPGFPRFSMRKSRRHHRRSNRKGRR